MRTFIFLLALLIPFGCGGPITIPKQKPEIQCTLKPGKYFIATEILRYSKTCKNIPKANGKEVIFPPGQQCGIFPIPMKGAQLVVKITKDMIIGSLIVSDGKCTIEYGVLGLPVEEEIK